MFKTVLIANRGEIALRIARTCRELDVRTVAVYSTADRDSVLLDLVDDAVLIGPAPARASYLNMPAVITAAQQVGADAIHPGYGFLSEEADFAEACAANGIVLIGPPARVMRATTNKATAKMLMAKAGLPVLPGSTGTVDTIGEARAVAARIGFPLIIKAAAGGGGMGMTTVLDGQSFVDAYKRTVAHAKAVFGDGRVYVERFLSSARHVEIQVLCDRHGAAVQLGERDCSVQRRHQKILEETPAPGLSSAIAEAMGRAAVSGARAIGYEGAGTFEFLLDDTGAFHFMEINGRIQVEHPVTEMVTGVDLVGQQLLVAAGERLELEERVDRRGSAIEARINAEDPERNFVPTPGTMTTFRSPGGPFVRVDTHGYAGMSIPPDYDSLLAKVIAWAPERVGAIARLDRAIAEFAVAGPRVRTTADFVRRVLAEPAFRTGTHTTSLVGAMPAGPPLSSGSSR